MSVIAQPNIVQSGLVLALDAGNPRSYSTNTFPNPLDTFGYFGSAGTNNCTISRDTTIAPSPAGGIPLRMSVTGNDPYIVTYASTVWSFATAASGQTWTVSVWIRASAATTAGFFIFGADNTGNYIELVNPMFSVTTEWQRYSGSITLGNSSTVALQVRFDGPDSGGSGVNIWYDGLQVEKTSAASTFNGLYNANGATWMDLSEYKNHHSLIGAPNWASGKIALDGSTQGVSRLSSMSGVTTTNTVVIWYSTTDTQELWVRGNQNNGYYLSASYGNPYYNSNCGSPTNYVDLALTTNPATPINYRDGIYHMWEAKNVDFVTVPWTSYEWWLYPSSWQMSGTVTVIMIYNRVITTAESAQNFAAYRSRFGI